MRAAEDGDGMVFEGYASVFNTDSDGPIPGFGVERILPGAFKRSLGMKRDIKMFLNHNSDLLLASRDAGTLDLAEDDIGLLARARFIDTTVGLDTAKNVRAKNVTKMSFGFSPVRFAARTDGTEGTEHAEVSLWEVSPVTSWPAYDATSASVRHLTHLAETDPEQFKHEAEGFLERLTPEGCDFVRDYLNRHSEIPLLEPNLVAQQSKLRDHEAALADMASRIGLA
ncbi:MAG: HK97 family phage prohead protease [Chloroflexi bacterium]|nr:HK97 family phage prohead protease [Chloroflexota bacterium]